MNNKTLIDKTPSFVLTLPLQTKVSDESALHKYFKLSHKIYNAIVHEGYKRLNLMKQSKEYQQARKLPKNKDRTDEFKRIKEKYGFTKNQLSHYVTKLRVNEYSKLGAAITQNLLERVWRAFQKLLFGNGYKVYYKKFDELNSIEGKNNLQGIKIRGTCMNFNKLSIPIKIKNNDYYVHEALKHRVKYGRIKRMRVKGKWRYYIQIVLEGIPPKKYNLETGEIKHPVNDGEVGLDIGTQTIAIVSNKCVVLKELAEGLDYKQKEKVRLQRRLDRQRRVNNPHKYNDDGTINKSKEKWIWSKSYFKTKAQLQDIIRKVSSQRKIFHNKDANFILSQGDTIKVEKMRYNALQKRVKETTINENTGRFNKKKRFGRSIGNKAPSMLLSIIDKKLGYYEKELLKVDTVEIKASQYNPFTNEYVKKELNERWNVFNINAQEVKIQRDLFSAFLIKNVIIDKKLNKIDREKCLHEFESFKMMHDVEVEKLKNSNNKKLSSMGI